MLSGEFRNISILWRKVEVDHRQSGTEAGRFLRRKSKVHILFAQLCRVVRFLFAPVPVTGHDAQPAGLCAVDRAGLDHRGKDGLQAPGHPVFSFYLLCFPGFSDSRY